MSWRDNLRQASFRGAFFKVDSSSYSVGRRTQVNQYVNRELPFVDDNGREADSYEITALIIQTQSNDFDYFAERDLLISKLKQKGPGLLIHPYYGVKRVVLVGQASISESFERGGMCAITMSFIEAGIKPRTNIAKNLIGLANNIDKVVNTVSDKLGDFYATASQVTGVFSGTVTNSILTTANATNIALTGVVGLPTRGLHELKKTIGAIVNTYTSAKTSLTGVSKDTKTNFHSMKRFSDTISEMCGLGSKTKEERDRKSGIPETNTHKASNTRFTLKFPGERNIVSSVLSGETGYYSGITKGENVLLDGNSIPEPIAKSVIDNTLYALDNFNTNNYQTTPKEQQQNVVLTFHTYFTLILANLCRIAIRTSFLSQETIITYRAKIVDAFDDLLIEVGDAASLGSQSVGIGDGLEPIQNEAIFSSIEYLRNAFIDNMTKKITITPSTIDYQALPGGENIITLAYDQYNDLSMALDAFYRNKNIIQNPLFVDGNKELRIVSE